MRRLHYHLGKIACLCLLALLWVTQAAASKTILIAFVGPLSGSSALYGQSLKNAAQLAIDEANLQTNTIDGRRASFKLSVHDDKEDSNMAVVIASYLTRSDAVGVIGNINTANSLVSAQIFDAVHLAHISPASAGRDYTRKGYRSAFRAIGHDDQAIDLLLPYLRNELHITRMAVINNRTHFGKGIGDLIEQAMREQNTDLLVRDTVSARSVDFNAALDHIRRVKAEAIFFAGNVEQAAMLARSIKRKNLKLRLITAMAGTASTQFLSSAGAASEGVISLEYGLPPEQMPGWKKFYASYYKAFGDQINPFTVCAYDATKVLIAAIRQAGSSDRRTVVERLHAIRYQGAMGPISFTPKGDLLKPFFTIYEVRNLKWQTVKVMQSPS